MAKKRPTLSDLLNDLTFRIIYDKYKLIAINQFQWDGLPEGITERFLETKLFEEGRALFFIDPDMSYMCLGTQYGKGLDPYGEPLSHRAIGLNYNREYDRDDCVLIENNKLRLATNPFIMFYVNKLTEAERTMDVNIKAVKTPIVFAVDDKDILTFKRLFQQVDGNVPAIFADKNLNLDAIQVFDTKAKFLCNDLMEYKKLVENELLTFLGQNNIPVEKKERLITDEANSNNQLIQSFCDLQLEARQRACEEINKKYGLQVSVKRRQENVEGVENNVDNTEDVRHNEVDS